MKNTALRATALTMCAALLLCLAAPAALAATDVAPVSVAQGAWTKAEFFGLYPDGQPNTNERYDDITSITFKTEGVAEAQTQPGGLFIRGMAEGATSFTAKSKSGGTLTGTLSVHSVAQDVKIITFERGEIDVVVPSKIRLFVGQSFPFHAQKAAFMLSSPNQAVLRADRGKILVKAVAPGAVDLVVRDNVTGNVALCWITVENLGVKFTYSRDLERAPLKAGETVTAKVSFDPTLTSAQLAGGYFLSRDPGVAVVDAKTGAITGKAPGVARIFYYLPLTGGYYPAQPHIIWDGTEGVKVE